MSNWCHLVSNRLTLQHMLWSWLFSHPVQAVSFYQFQQLSCCCDLFLSLCFCGNIEIIIITGMADFFSFADFPPHFSGKNLSFNIVLVKISDCIFMAFISLSIQRMNSIDGMKNGIVSSIIRSLIFLRRKVYLQILSQLWQSEADRAQGLFLFQYPLYAAPYKTTPSLLIFA